MSDYEHALRHPGSIELHIEELVLHGFSAGDRHAIADGLQIELAKLLTEEKFSLPTAVDTRLEYLDAGAFRVPESRSGLLGGQVAHALLGSLKDASEIESRAGARAGVFENRAATEARYRVNEGQETK
jgi:hypothetical protein